MRRRLAAGNWKMHGTGASLAELESLLEGPSSEVTCERLICPPTTLLDRARSLIGNRDLALGGQDCHVADHGAHTGDVSAEMLRDAGASYVILGHSERRQHHQESSALVREKAGTALGAGLKLVICVGETEAQRDAANTTDIILGQMAGSIPDECTGETLVVAYEPVWAIGTGRTPTLDQIAEVHQYMRARLERRFGAGVGKSVRLLYGGSVKPSNAAEIFSVPNVDGALVGGASLKAADFGAIIAALEAA